jgi:hypothetical protein
MIGCLSFCVLALACSDRDIVDIVVVAIWPAGSPATVARQVSRPFLVEIALNIGLAPVGASRIGCIEIGDVVGDKPAVGPRYRGADDLGARRSA